MFVYGCTYIHKELLRFGIRKFNKSECAKDLKKHLMKEDKEIANKQIKNMLNIIYHQSKAN